tara:strand:+ start:234 stop:542 length:309 start_codon:yes stop_codon:yes gene_type:complete
MRKWLIIIASIVAIFCICKFLFSHEEGNHLNGDVNLDGLHCIDDSVQLIYHLWRDGRELPCFATADIDCDGDLDVSDVIMNLRYVFFGDPIDTLRVTCYPDY